MTKRNLCGLLAALLFVGFATAQPDAPPAADGPLPEAPFPRGYKPLPPEVRAAMHAEAFERHELHVMRLPQATAPKFDCRETFKNVLPVDNQGECGDCYGVSAFDGCSMAFIRAKKLPLDPVKGRLSSQYGLDNPSAFRGGCGGGSEVQVIDFVKKHGAPLTSDYGPYTARKGHPKPIDGMTLYKIDDWGYCTPRQEGGIADTQDMKNCMAQYGPISVAFDAGGCDGYRWPAVISGRGRNVDHAVLCIGWDDEKGAFLGMNQWGSRWGGPNGTFWIKYGAYSWGTEAVWVTAGDPPEPTPAPHVGGGHWLPLAGLVLLVVVGVVVFFLLRRKPTPPAAA